MNSGLHEPVLLREVVNMLNCAPGKNFVDCTLGTGGHAGAILEKVGKDGRLVGIDCDGTAIAIAKERLRQFGVKFVPVHDNFINIERILKRLNLGSVDGILFDLGISSHQLDDGSRGFSFMNNGPLDMRMDRGQDLTASDVVNQFPEHRLAEVLWSYGDERKARRITRYIIESRKTKSVQTTKELAGIITRACRHRGRIHPATRTFQAVRIAVNRELEVLGNVLEKAVYLLCAGGRICVISYHSLEDRIVKNEFLRLSSNMVAKREVGENAACERATFTVITRKPIIPSQEELSLNRRSRSAKLRVGEKVL